MAKIKRKNNYVVEFTREGKSFGAVINCEDNLLGIDDDTMKIIGVSTKRKPDTESE